MVSFSPVKLFYVVTEHLKGQVIDLAANGQFNLAVYGHCGVAPCRPGPRTLVVCSLDV